jgi:hypothetical protein
LPLSPCIKLRRPVNTSRQHKAEQRAGKAKPHCDPWISL